MHFRKPWLLALLIPLSLLALAACADSSDDDPDVQVSGTITYSSWSTGNIIVVVYPQGVDAGPEDIEGLTSVAGATSVAYSVTVKGNQTVWVFAWNDSNGDGSPTFSAGEFRGCSGDTVLAEDDVSGVDFALTSDTACATAP